MEMSFVTQEDILQLVESMFTELVQKIFPNKRVQQTPWPRIPHREAKEKYRDIPVPQIIDDLAQVTQRVVEFLTSVPQENLFRERAFEYEGEKLSVVWVLSYPEHDREHAQQILAWRRQRGI